MSEFMASVSKVRRLLGCQAELWFVVAKRVDISYLQFSISPNLWSVGKWHKHPPCHLSFRCKTSSAQHSSVQQQRLQPSFCPSVPKYKHKMVNCPKCDKPVYFAEKKTSMGKDWHSACLKCERCNKTLTPGSHAVREDKPYCHTPCYATLFGPSGVGVGGSSYKYDQK